MNVTFLEERYCHLSDYGSKVRSFRQWVGANCAALPKANGGQYATSHCKPLPIWFPRQRWYI